jgi:hypothetical protein
MYIRQKIFFSIKRRICLVFNKQGSCLRFMLLFIFLWNNNCFAEIKFSKLPVKIGAEIGVYGIHRNNFDLKDEYTDSGGAVRNDDETDFAMSITRFEINADLLKNLFSQIRFTNQTDWDTDKRSGDVDVELANISFVNKPLKLTVGRQQIRWGRAFFIGKFPVEPEETITQDELTAFIGFDALRAILELAPWNIDVFISNVHRTRFHKEKVDLYGVNVGYEFPKYQAEVESYFLADIIDKNYNAVIGGRTYEESKIYSLGFRGSIKPVENLDIFWEGIKQFGKLIDKEPTYFERNRDGWGYDLGCDYTFKTKFSPKIGIEYVHLSGEEASSSGDYSQYASGRYGYRTKQCGWIRTFQGIYYKVTVDPNDTGADVNNRSIQLRFSLKPIEKLTLETRYTRGYFDEKPVAGRSRHAGDEIDTWVTYQQNKNICFGLMTGFLFPGRYYDGQATEASRSADMASLIMSWTTMKF